MPWITRGLRDGIVTTRYPRRPDGYGDGFRGAVRVLAPEPTAGPATPDGENAAAVSALCPTGAIRADGGQVRVDQGRCVVCGRCVAERPDRFTFVPSHEVAGLTRASLVAGDDGADDEALAGTREALARRVRALRRSVHVRHVDAGSDGAEEWEVNALLNPVYDVHRLGIFFTASPRHADLLLVTGVVTTAMAGPLRLTYEAMPDPRVVLAAGTDATSGGLVHPTYATEGGVGGVLPVDVWVPGSPPSPFSLLHGILLGLGLLGDRRRALAAASTRGPARGGDR